MSKKLALLIFIFPFIVRGEVKRPQHIIDSLLNELSNTSEDTSKVKVLYSLSFAYSDVDPDKGIEYGFKSKELAEKLEWDYGVASACADLGINYAALSDQSQAIYYDLKALDLYRQIGEYNRAGGIMSNLSLVYLSMSDYPKALEYAFKALRIKTDYNDDYTVAIIQENIGSIYLEQKQYTKTKKYYAKALQGYTKLNDSIGIARIYGNHGIVEDALGNYAVALDYHLKALEISRKYGNRNTIQINLVNVGIVYSHQSDYTRALEYQFLALNLSEELGNPGSIAINNGNIGETYYYMASNTINRTAPAIGVSGGRASDLKQSIQYLEKAVKLCKEINYAAPMIEFLDYLSKAYQLAGKDKEALLAFKQCSVLKDSIFSQQTKLKLAGLETQRELDLKNKDITIKNKEIEIARLEAANERNARIAYIIIIILLVTVMVFVIMGLRKRISMHRSALDDIASIHAHDIRGPVARIIGLTQLFNHEDVTDPVNKELVDAINKVSVQLDDIVKQVVDKSSS